jgi:hypothetical protein
VPESVEYLKLVYYGRFLEDFETPKGTLMHSCN